MLRALLTAAPISWTPSYRLLPVCARHAGTISTTSTEVINIPIPSTAEVSKYMSKYMTLLTEEEQADVLSKFVAGGYVGAKLELVPRLNNEDLECIGIQPELVRLALLHGFEDAGPAKTVVIVDWDGTEYEMVFNNRREFNDWMQAAGHSFIKVLPNGKKLVFANWERLEDVGRYFK